MSSHSLFDGWPSGCRPVAAPKRLAHAFARSWKPAPPQTPTLLATPRLLLLIVLCLVGLPARAQTKSDYYQNPTDTTLYSRALAQPRQLTVILPTTFNPARKTKYPLILVFDRQNQDIFRQLYESINYLTRFDAMPEAVIVGLTSSPSQRNRETSLPADMAGARGEELLRFVFDELLPWCAATYHTGACRTLIGHSRFGYFSTVMMCRQATQLSGVIALSPFYQQGRANWVDSVTTRFAPTQPLARRLCYRFVTGDSLSDTPGYARMHAALRRAKLHPNFDWGGAAFYQAKHHVVPGLGVLPALLDIFQPWSATADAFSSYPPVGTQLAYAAFQAKMQQVYGEEMSLGLARLNGLGNEYNAEKQYDKALFFWRQLLDEYPFFSATYVDIAELLLVQGQRKEAKRYLERGLQSLRANRFLPAPAQAQLAQTMQQKLATLR
ncbi:alpha/beta hydrolase-fold protein [Hymenobacter crusticola]|uniref:Uncharacterized protein n=1 Tax=Hymenobacter crusticola TaxID=1770526 RepID=A0A243W4T9_9BACT|nr:alpha/beta hydrolase-fold protein [Hymenobacter crusticola]OUJ67372.1 hypothetical protein BXP70_28875 [Hymenobacter crusticola]